MSKANKTQSDKPANSNRTLQLQAKEGKSREYLMAEVGLSSLLPNATTASTFAQQVVGELSITDSTKVLQEKIERVQSGNLAEVESILMAQAIALDAMFNNLAKRSASNMGQYINASEIYMRMALKAQAQCRATLETLAEVKYPKSPTFVRQQNVAYQQQVNNGNATSTPAHAREKNLPTSNEFLEEHHGQRLDAGAQGTASRADSQLETVGAIKRPED